MWFETIAKCWITGRAMHLKLIVEVLTGSNRKTPAIQENERVCSCFLEWIKHDQNKSLDCWIFISSWKITAHGSKTHGFPAGFLLPHPMYEYMICVPSPGFNHLPDSSWFHIFKKTSQLSPSQISMFFHPIPYHPWSLTCFYGKKRVVSSSYRKRIRNFIILTLSHSNKIFWVFLNSKALSLYTLWHFVSRSIPSTLSQSSANLGSNPPSPAPIAQPEPDPFGQGTGKAGPFRVPLRVQKVVLAKPEQLLNLLGIRPRAQTLQGL